MAEYLYDYYKSNEIQKRSFNGKSRKIILRIWDSPTFATWGSFLSKSLYAVLLLPVITTVLSSKIYDMVIIQYTGRITEHRRSRFRCDFYKGNVIRDGGAKDIASWQVPK